MTSFISSTSSTSSTNFADIMGLTIPDVKYRVIDWETFAYLVGAKHQLDVVYASDTWLILVETPYLKDELWHLYNLVLSCKDHDASIDFYLEVCKSTSLPRLKTTMSDEWYFEYLDTHYLEAIPLNMAPYETGYDEHGVWVLRVPTYYSESSEASALQKGFATAVSLDTRPYKTSREGDVWKLEVKHFLTKSQEECNWAPAQYFFEAPYTTSCKEYGPDKGVWTLVVTKHVATQTVDTYEALGFMPAVDLP
jgi:hypothetical protein